MITIQESDIAEVVELNQKIPEFLPYYSKQEFEERYTGRETLILIAYMNSEPVGYIVGYHKDTLHKIFYCWMAGVIPQYRRNGVLTKLMTYQIDWAKRQGYTCLQIKTRNTRRGMLHFLVQNDFDIVDVEGKDIRKENRVLFEKNLA